MKKFDRKFRVGPEIQGEATLPSKGGNTLGIVGILRWETLEVTRHPRYLSEFDSNYVCIDARHPKGDQESLMEIDLNGLVLQCDGKESIYDRPMRLVEFPHLCSALKLAFNYTLFRNARGNIRLALMQTRTNAMRIFAWMMRSGKYHLSDITPADIDRLANEVGTHGWASSLDLNDRLKSLVERVRLDPFLAKSLMGTGEVKWVTINIGLAEQYIGGPIDASYVSSNVRAEIAQVAGDKRKAVEPKGKRQVPAGGLLRELFHTLNLLSNTPVDSIPFLAVPNTLKKMQEFQRVRDNYWAKIQVDQANSSEKIASSLPATNKTATQNLSIDDCARLCSEALKWLYDYKNGILITLEYARALLTSRSPPHDRAVKQRVLDKWIEVAKTQKLPRPTIHSLTYGSASLIHQVKLLLFSLYIIIGICSGRRPGEIHGHGLPFGLYYGALKQIDSDIPAWDIEIYIEKSPQDYAIFPANALVADSMAALEHVFRLMQKKDSSEVPNFRTIQLARKQKLFTFRQITRNGFSASKAFDYNPRSDLAEFFALAGVDPVRFKSTIAPFRRMFATLFTRRYDLKEFHALRDYLCHLDAATTHGYFSDRNRPLKKEESIRSLHPMDASISTGMINEIKAAGKDYMVDLIHRLLRGELIGGVFPLMVSKLHKRLSATINFRELGLERQAGILASTMEGRGYLPTPMKHVVCAASSPRHTTRLAKCFRDGLLHPADSSPSLCVGCVNSIRPNAYLENLAEAKSHSEQEALNDFLPQPIRDAHLQRSKMIEDVLLIEHKLAEKNRRHFETILSTWSVAVGEKLYD